MRRDQCPGQLRVDICNDCPLRGTGADWAECQDIGRFAISRSDYDAEWARRHVSPSGYNHVGELIKMFEESEVGKAALRRIREEEAQGEQ
jgi:hypothetical protein